MSAPKENGTAALETRKIDKSFGGVKAVNELSISIPKGVITAIVGPNGSGKSTLINLLSGTLPLDGGIVVFGDSELRIIKAHESPDHGVTRTFQEVRLFEQITVLDNLLIAMTERSPFAALFQRANRRHREKAESILETVGLLEKRNGLAEELSYGQRKLLEIGRVMAMDVDIYLLDEPFAGLAVHMLDLVQDLIRNLRDQGHTIIFVSHNMGIVRALAEHLITLESGRLLAEGDAHDVLNDPAVIKAYLGD